VDAEAETEEKEEGGKEIADTIQKPAKPLAAAAGVGNSALHCRTPDQLMVVSSAARRAIEKTAPQGLDPFRHSSGRATNGSPLIQGILA
jgi:hypothetical protein